MRCTVASPMPVPSKSARVVQALERAEQLAGVAHVEARAVVAHEEGGSPLPTASAELDPRPAARRAVNFQALSAGCGGRPAPAADRPRRGSPARSTNSTAAPGRPAGSSATSRAIPLRSTSSIAAASIRRHSRELAADRRSACPCAGRRRTRSQVFVARLVELRRPTSSISAWLKPSMARSGARRSCETE